MPCKAYETVKFNPVQQRMIDQVIEIVDRYRADGYDLTLRQIYYQCVGHDLFPDDRKFTWTGAKWVRDPNGTIDCPNCIMKASQFIAAAYSWLIDHDGATADDPGYFA